MIEQTLQAKIETFLSTRRESDGGWAKITSDDVRLLDEIVYNLIEAKCEPDSDGDFPIRFYLVNNQIERFACSPKLLRVHQIGEETLEDTYSIALAIESLSKELCVLLSWLNQKMSVKNRTKQSKTKKKK